MIRAAFAVVLAAHTLVAAASAQVPRDTAAAVHLLERATFGVTPAALADALADGPTAWLERQLDPGRIGDGSLEERLARFPAASLSAAELFESQARPRRMVAEAFGARLARAVHSERQLEEVMTEFWFNHFNVFAGKGPVRFLAVDYERSAIRPHVFGRFEDMLVATAQHPAMLVYLDNARSVAPSPELMARAERAGRPVRGLNENYARELLELHTLGVAGGYTQQDVVEVARAFTGWSARVPNPRRRERMMAGETMATGDVAFQFRPNLHDREAKTVLGRTLAPGRGLEDGLDVLLLLTRHPSTARHVATRLATWFVADQPPQALIDELADVFLRTDGDLRAVTRALFTSPHFYDAAHRGAKLKSPFRLAASALRAVDAEVVGPSRTLTQSLQALGNLPYMASPPTGYPAESTTWASAGAMVERMNLALAIGAGSVDGVRFPGGATGSDRALTLAAPAFQRH